MEQKKNAAADESERRELTSWKEIAHYLGVNVRTAQKWERDRGLPVHRLVGPRGRVSADIARLCTWRNGLTQSGKLADHSFRWPLGPGLTVEVHFVGPHLTREHVELLTKYLKLVKTACFDRS